VTFRQARQRRRRIQPVGGCVVTGWTLVPMPRRDEDTGALFTDLREAFGNVIPGLLPGEQADGAEIFGWLVQGLQQIASAPSGWLRMYARIQQPTCCNNQSCTAVGMTQEQDYVSLIQIRVPRHDSTLLECL
jgi:hypothetical protein